MRSPGAQIYEMYAVYTIQYECTVRKEVSMYRFGTAAIMLALGVLIHRQDGMLLDFIVTNSSSDKSLIYKSSRKTADWCKSSTKCCLVLVICRNPLVMFNLWDDQFLWKITDKKEKKKFLYSVVSALFISLHFWSLY